MYRASLRYVCVLKGGGEEDMLKKWKILSCQVKLESLHLSWNIKYQHKKEGCWKEGGKDKSWRCVCIYIYVRMMNCPSKIL